MFGDRSMIQIGRITRVPFPIAFVELKLHQVPYDRSHHHFARLSVYYITELENFVVSGSPFSHSQPLVPGQYSGDGFGH